MDPDIRSDPIFAPISTNSRTQIEAMAAADGDDGLGVKCGCIVIVIAPPRATSITRSEEDCVSWFTVASRFYRGVIIRCLRSSDTDLRRQKLAQWCVLRLAAPTCELQRRACSLVRGLAAEWIFGSKLSRHAR